MGLYTLNGSTYNAQYHFFRIAFPTTINLLNCVSSK